MTPRYPKYIKSAEVTAINSWSVAARTTELMHADYNGFEKAGKSIKKAKHHNSPLGGDGMTPRYPKYIKSAEVTAINSWSVAARTTELMHADYNGFEKVGKSIKKVKHHNNSIEKPFFSLVPLSQ